MDNELYEILSAFRDSLDAVNHKLEELEAKGAKVDELEARIENEIIQPALQKIEHDEDEANYNDFHSKYGEKLDKYADMLKSLEGDKYDVSRDAYNGWKSYEAPEGFTKPEEADGYVDAFVSAIEEKIEGIKKAMGLPEDTEVEVKADENGIELEIEGKSVEEAEKEEKSEDELSEDDVKEIEELKKEFEGWSV